MLVARESVLESRQREVAEELADVRRMLARARPGLLTSTATETETAPSRNSRASSGAGRRSASRKGPASPDASDPVESALGRLAEHVSLAAGSIPYLRELIRLRDEGFHSVTVRQLARRGSDGKVSGPESATASTNLRRLAEKGLVEREDDDGPARYRLSRKAEGWIAVS